MKTKILSLLLVVAVLFGVTATFVSCGECTHEDMPQAFTRVNETLHQRVCPACGYTESGGHTYKLDIEKYEADPFALMLTEACEGCGDERQVANDMDRFTLEMQKKADSYPWQSTELLMSVCDNSNVYELESGGRAYVSGEWDPTGNAFEPANTVSKVDQDILDGVRARNDSSLTKAKVTLTYTYMGAVAGAWNTALSTIATENTAATTPDIYYNFIYHMVGASINGYFKNIQGNTYLAPFYDCYSEEKDDAGLASNVVDTHGYNWDYMKDLSFSAKAMYLIASDYSFDISRAYFVMPVNGTLLQTVTEITGDVNKDGTVGDTADFLAMVNNGDWTWAKIAAYTDAVKTGDSSSHGYSLTGGNNDCIAGFAMSTTSGLCSAPVMYTGELSMVSRTVVNGEYRYTYPTEVPPTLLQIFKAARDYIGLPGQGSSLSSPTGGDGVILYSGSSSQVDAVFAADRLFVNTACVLGIIESETYQNMWDSSKGSGNGFVVTPAAKISDTQENYRTLVHNVGKVFAISSKATQTETDAACAFINHQTIDSSTLLREYFVWSLGYGAANTDENVLVLAGMSNNLKFGIDKVIEDAFGIVFNNTQITNPLNPDEKMDASGARLHIYMIRNWDAGEEVTAMYNGLRKWKLKNVTKIQEDFLKNGTT